MAHAGRADERPVRNGFPEPRPHPHPHRTLFPEPGPTDPTHFI